MPSLSAWISAIRMACGDQGEIDRHNARWDAVIQKNKELDRLEMEVNRKMYDLNRREREWRERYNA